MPRVSELSEATATALSNHCGILNLTGLTTLSDTAAKSLSLHWGRITINSNTVISDEAEILLSKCKMGFFQTKLSDDKIVLETKRFFSVSQSEYEVRQSKVQQVGRRLFKLGSGGKDGGSGFLRG